MIGERESERPSDGRLLLAFLGLALVLRLPGHLNSGLWYDEIWLLVESIRVPFGSLFTHYESDNNHPFYSVLAWLSVNAFGEHVWSLRLPAVVFGVASIGAMWKLARYVTDRAEAALATFLLVISYHHVWFSQNARGYTMLLFWTLAATYFLLKTYDGGGRRAWLAYALCLALATFTHASAVLVATAQGIVSVFVLATSSRNQASRREQRWGPLIGLGAAGLLSLGLHAGMLGGMLAFFTGAAGEPGAAAAVAAAGPSQWTTVWWTVAAVVQSLGVPAPIGYLALALGAGVALIGTVVWARRDWKATLLFILPGVLSVAAALAMGRSLRPRFLFHLEGFALLIVVAGAFAACRWVARRLPISDLASAEAWMNGAAALAMVAGSLAILPRAYRLPKQDFEGALQYAQALRSAGETVAMAGLTVMPYRDFYHAGFAEVDSMEDLDRLLADRPAVYVLNTIPIYLESRAPALAARLAESPEVARFRGSLGDGDVVVYRLGGARSGD